MAEENSNVVDVSKGFNSIAVYYKTENQEHIESYLPKDETDMAQYLKNTIGTFFSKYCSVDNVSMVKRMEELHLFDGKPLCLSQDKVSLEYYSGSVKYWSVLWNYYIRVSCCSNGKETVYMLVCVQWNRKRA